MEGEGYVLVEEAGEGGLGRGEPEAQSEEWGQLVWDQECAGGRGWA